MGDVLDKLANSYGDNFADLFSNIMKIYYGDRFQQTQTYGNKGDMKVDGVLNDNIAFAVYAPEVYKDTKAINKIKSDFYGFLEHKKNGKWTNIDTWILVIKSNRKKGVTSEVINLIAKLKTQHNSLDIKIWTLDDIALLIGKNGIFSDLYANILVLKDLYIELNQIYNDMGRNSNRLFHPKNEENGIMWYKKFYQTYYINCEIATFRHNNYFLADDLGIGKKLDDLINLAPPYNQDGVEMLYSGFVDMVNEEKQNKRIELCDLLLREVRNK